ncbi:GNAT family protein [Methylocaldum sp.]|uniref:GNAT family N-acetyltransferase n=1 Tax=Methylocaldum sp. TaxID=1969727 RepID=UPI002D7385DF|nr:GNAT family protein [Methylocaldum sp.]HYE36464.1 GNAT family protein [Methylocaldum sp.]
MRIEFERGVIRDWSERDKADLVEFADNRKIWRNLTDRFPYPYTEKDAIWWIAHVAEMPAPTSWAIEVDGRAVGGIGIELREGIYAKSAEFGSWLGEPYWGRGITTAAARALLPEILSQFGLIRLEARVFAWNPASMRVLEKAGFKREGVIRCAAIKDGVLIDQALYAYVEESVAV